MNMPDDALGVTRKPVVLVVDDTPENLTLVNELLKDQYKVKLANNGERAIRLSLSDPIPDIILLDVMMPGLDGYEVCRRLKAHDRTVHVPVIFLTAMSKGEDEAMGMALGAVDYITKPINESVLKARIKNHLDLKLMRDFLLDQNHFLLSEVTRRTQQITALQEVTVFVLASLAETRDNETGNHIRRTQHYVRLLAETLRHHPRFAYFLNVGDTIEQLFKSAPLHDIGKVGIPDHILMKPGPLTREEFEIMKTHTTLGRDSIIKAESELGIELPFLKYAKEIAHSHQEKWDGSGYPQGLSGDAIPISARLMALADVYDALVNERVYKPRFAHGEAVRIIMEGKGSHFDPDIADAFQQLEKEFNNIALLYAD